MKNHVKKLKWKTKESKRKKNTKRKMRKVMKLKRQLRLIMVAKEKVLIPSNVVEMAQFL
ncbi:hypothetical protein Pint_18653 [Pistacia integerrima]|uniref:Uncharacterized protein n=1 Tax=Pistacia integerrima TaxID=434235 RepID=A0ACC0Z1I5_9ROSI|nr:hypothetical protein Pint_18653 [Pistacia integerrima]